jgi:GDP-L-fucose synthase
MGKRILVTGHRGMVGAAVCRKLAGEGHALITRTRRECDLRDHRQVTRLIESTYPEEIIFCAGRVGGIKANSEAQAGFLTDNARMAINTITAARASGVERFMYLSSTCVYPREHQSLCRSDHLLEGQFEPTNEGYALAKVVGMKLCEYARRDGLLYHSVLPPNVYGIGDNYDPKSSHVVASLIHKFHQLQHGTVGVWGKPDTVREIIFSEDLACAIGHIRKDPTPADRTNIAGRVVSIEGLVETIRLVTGSGAAVKYTGDWVGVPSKRVADGYKLAAQAGVREGVERAYMDYLERMDARKRLPL